jgi:tagatose 6-phosphate kinase
MIITVTPNPAWDVTYAVPELVPGNVHRVTDVHRRLGGKGVNAARVLAATGHAAVAVLPGPGGLASADRLLSTAGFAGEALLTWDVVPGLPAIRQTLVVHGGDGVTTSLWEPGIAPAPDMEETLAGRVRALLDSETAAGIVIAGSLPPGLDPRLPARLASLALDAGVPALVDTSGDALVYAAAVPGIVLAPNASELAQLAGAPGAGTTGGAAAAQGIQAAGIVGVDMTEAVAAARAVRAAGPHAVVATLGADGLVAVTADGAWHGCLGRPLDGNPTGAGDAAAAALIAGLAGGAGWPEIVRDAVATSAAAVLSPVAGEVATADIGRLRSQVIVSEVT